VPVSLGPVTRRVGICSVLVLSVVPGTASLAQDATVQGGCLLSPAKFSDALIRAFVERPTDLLERHPHGGVAMSAEVRRLAASDVATVAGIISDAKGASPAQVVAIGAGLAQASELCSRFRVEVQHFIEKGVAAAGQSDLAAAFAVYKISPGRTTPLPEAEFAGRPTIGNSVAARGAAAPSPGFSGGGIPATEKKIATVPGDIDIGPFATSQTALPFFAGRGGVGGGAPPESAYALRIQLGEISFSQTALPWFGLDQTGTVPQNGGGDGGGNGGGKPDHGPRGPHAFGAFGGPPGSADGGFTPGLGLAGTPSIERRSTMFGGGGGGVTDTTQNVVSPSR